MNIDWTQALIAGIAGGLLAALFALAKLLYGRLAPRFGRVVAASLSAVSIATLGVAAAYSPLGTTVADYRAKQQERARIAHAMSEHMKPLLESPAFQQRVKGLSQTEVSALAFQLSSQGLLRLSDERLIRRAYMLNEATSLAGEATCASQLLGPTPEQAQQLLANLSEESLREWSKISAEASAASLRDEPRLIPSQSEVQEAFRRLLAGLPEAAANRLADALGNPTALDPVNACWTAKTIYQTFVSLPQEDQALIARVLAMQ